MWTLSLMAVVGNGQMVRLWVLVSAIGGSSPPSPERLDKKKNGVNEENLSRFRPVSWAEGAGEGPSVGGSLGGCPMGVCLRIPPFFLLRFGLERSYSAVARQYDG